MKKSVSQSRNSVFGTFTSFSVSPNEDCAENVSESNDKGENKTGKCK